MKIILTMLMAMALVGCLPASSDALKSGAGGTVEFEVKENYQAVYRRVAPIMRSCYESAWLGDSQGVRAEIFSDIRKAELVAEGQNMLLGKRVLLQVELEGLGDELTRIRAWEPFGTVFVNAVRAWVTEGYLECQKR